MAGRGETPEAGCRPEEDCDRGRRRTAYSGDYAVEGEEPPPRYDYDRPTFLSFLSFLSSEDDHPHSSS